MIKAELKSLFEKDSECFEHKDITSVLLRNFDNFIIDRIDENFNYDILNVYKKFEPMKQQAPESMKTVLFATFRDYAKDETLKGNSLNALVLYRFLIVKTVADSLDYLAIAKNLVKLDDKNLYHEFLKIYSQKENNKPLSYIELADFYKSINDYKNAIKYYEKFLETDKTKVAVYTITADLYSKLNGSESLEKQIELYEQAFKIQPDNRLVLHGLAFGYEKLGKSTRANIFYEKLLKNNPTENDFYNYGGFLIHCGDFKNGHKYFTHRFNIDDINLKYPADINKKWDFKSDISDKTLLVHYEQGFGDSIMYCRFVPFLKKLAKKIIFVVQKEVSDLISNSEIFDGIEIATTGTGIDYDFNIALLDVPNVLNIDSNNLPFTSKYLDVNENFVKSYKNKFLGNDNIFRIGISCKGENSSNYNERDIDISKIYNIFENISDIKLYNLQKNADKLDNITQLGKDFENFTDSAYAIKNMDLIVSTDNVILNLAGALGVKTFGLFNKETNYRWFKTLGDNVGWYNSVYPLQNQKQNDWNDTLSKLSDKVLKYYKNI